MDATIVNIELNNSQALVLFEFLSRFNHQEGISFEDHAESLILFELEAKLERKLAAPLSENYLTILQKARESVRESY